MKKCIAFALVLVMPLMMLVVGAMWRLKPPAFGEGTVVFRTALTEKSPQVWAFAHEYCGKLWARYGAILTAISAAPEARAATHSACSLFHSMVRSLSGSMPF